MELGNRIKDLRLKHGLTQTELGEQIGVKKSAIAKYENGRVENMKRSTIKRLSAYFGVSPTYVMGWEDEGIRKDIELKNKKIKELENEIKCLQQNLTYKESIESLFSSLGINFKEIDKKNINLLTNGIVRNEGFRLFDDRTINLNIKTTDYSNMTHDILKFVTFQLSSIVNKYQNDTNANIDN